MPRGFIRDKLQLKLLILYILDHLIQPVDLAQLTDLALCDEGVDYFGFSEALAELVGTGHVSLEEEQYAITPKGREHCQVCKSAVPYSVRMKCDRHTGAVNAVLRRNSQIQTEVLPRSGEEYTVRMSLSDDAGSVISMDMLSYSREQSEQLARNFKNHAEEIYNAILTAMLADYGDDTDEGQS